IEADRLYLCIEAGALIQSLDGGATWVDRTPDSPIDTHTLAIHPLAPGRLYSAAGDGFWKPGSGYAESHDRGETWTRIADGLTHHYLFGLAVATADPDTVLVSAASTAMLAHDPTNAESYVYRRSGGGSWELAMGGLPAAQGMTIPTLAAHPTQDGVFYAASNQGVFRTGDAGRSWETVPIPWPPHYQFRNAHSLALAA
ncbi:MAG: WD40/YVTN/BNR-like repeat-containing protein, partial [Thermomicrobiales bacterium]